MCRHYSLRMFKTDYKFWYIRRNDDGYITDCAIRFYEGEHVTQKKRDRLGNPTAEDIVVYKRNKLLRTAVYSQIDFGNIKTDDELRLFLNKELDKDKERVAIDEQKIK